MSTELGSITHAWHSVLFPVFRDEWMKKTRRTLLFAALIVERNVVALAYGKSVLPIRKRSHSRAAAFVEGPDDEALAAAAIAAGKHIFEVRAVLVEVSFHVRARVAFDAERIEQRLFRSEKAH